MLFSIKCNVEFPKIKKGFGIKVNSKIVPTFWALLPALHDNTLAMLPLVVSTLAVSVLTVWLATRLIWKVTISPVARPLVVQTQAVP